MTKKKLLKLIEDQPDDYYVLYTGCDSKGEWQSTYYFEKQKNKCKAVLVDIAKEKRDRG